MNATKTTNAFAIATEFSASSAAFLHTIRLGRAAPDNETDAIRPGLLSPASGEAEIAVIAEDEK
jgi:hypothetical protein